LYNIQQQKSNQAFSKYSAQSLYLQITFKTRILVIVNRLHVSQQESKD